MCIRDSHNRARSVKRLCNVISGHAVRLLHGVFPNLLNTPGLVERHPHHNTGMVVIPQNTVDPVSYTHLQDESVRIAFQYMNLAMLMQQLHYNLPLQTWESDGADDICLANPVMLPDETNPDTWGESKSRYGKWRPFQLAFILMNLRSMHDRKSPERSVVDLIWFPTGGGKTEAYLGLSAYTIFVRRLQNKDDKGTAILMRYTLRLLTAQQYERASAMICACDLIREREPHLFGKNRITIGLWVGSSTTPNKEKDALDAFTKLYNNGGSNPFVILKYPWCGAQMGPVSKRCV